MVVDPNINELAEADVNQTALRYPIELFDFCCRHPDIIIFDNERAATINGVHVIRVYHPPNWWRIHFKGLSKLGSTLEFSVEVNTDIMNDWMTQAKFLNFMTNNGQTNEIHNTV